MGLMIDIKKQYKDFTLEVNFDNRGSRLGILGASGSGKSMLLKCLAGIITPDEGKIILNGRPLFDSVQGINVRPQKRKIGYLFQNYALFPHMTVAENIGIGLPKADKEQMAKILKIMDRFHLTALSEKYPRQISGGQQQRVALARCMILEPEILLLDEPFSALDDHLKDHLQKEVMDYLSDFNGDVVLVSHSRDEIYRMSDSLMVMEHGKSSFMGNTHEAFKSPKYKYVAKLTGCKNFSDLEDDGTFYFAKSWGLQYPKAEFSDVPKYLGIRAHDFIVHHELSEMPSNRFLKGKVLRTVEDIFELTFYIKPLHPSVSEDAEVVFKIAKSKWENRKIPDALILEIPLEHLIPLYA